MHIPFDGPLPLGSRLLLRRQDGGVSQPTINNDTTRISPTSTTGNQTFIYIVVAALVVLSLIVASYITFKNLRAKHPSGRFLPGNWLKQRWRAWAPGASSSSRGDYDRSLQRAHRNSDAPSSLNDRASRSHVSLDPDRELPNLRTGSEAEANVSSGNGRSGGVDRNTSVRSVMTLPAYSAMAHPTEQILGREGERAGIDVVVEFPETVEEEEERREDEMESLYQIRVARREEHAEREERRRLRREARERGDWDAYEELRRQARQRAQDSLGTRVSEQLIAEHQTADRSRRVSSVQYAELGVARHDGTRLRANSTDSDNRPLLDAAAAMGSNSRPGSTRTLMPGHSRGLSGSSVLSLSSMGSDDDAMSSRPGIGHRSSSVGIGDYEIINLNGDSRSRASSMSRSILTPSVVPSSGGDLGDARIPLADPPQYDNLGWEEAPPYESPIATRRPELPHGQSSNESSSPVVVSHSPEGSASSPPQLPTLNTLPAIEVTASVTPVDEMHAASFRNPPR